MKQIIDRLKMQLVVVTAVGAGLLCGCERKALYSGPVEGIYYKDPSGGISGFSRTDKGLPGTSAQVGEDVWVEIHPQWVFIELKKRGGYRYAIPSANIAEIIIGNAEANQLNPAK
jgi:hypothetical protein